ncbi:MAG: excisionase family DNA binding protein [Rhodothermales bacterium]|jgi:excisionase family DNA binding protein
MDDLITTAEAARIAGVGVTSIKRWANEALIRVTRTPGGHRRVSKSELVRFLKSGGHAGGSGMAAVNTGQPKDRDLNGSAPGTTGKRTSGIQPPDLDHRSAAEYWAGTVLAADVFSLQAALLAVRGKLGSWYDTLDEVTLGLRAIGRHWESGKISAMEEHIGTERLARALNTLTDTMPQSPSDPVCLLTCAPGDSHSLALSLLQLCLREAGWSSLWVGMATPIEDLFEVVRSGGIQMVAVSASAASVDSAGLAKFSGLVGAACAESGVHLALGGSGAWPDSPPFGRRFQSFSEFHGHMARLTW